MQLRDIAKFGSNDDLRQSLQTLATRLESVAASIYQRKDPNAASRVFPRIARSTAEQLLLLARFISEPIEITASVCRTVFEINVTFRYCLLTQENLEDFATQRGTDEISIYKAIKRLHTEGDHTEQHAILYKHIEHLRILDKHIEHLRGILRRHNRPMKPVRPSLREMAKAVGAESDYDCLYGLYSKYVHASAWFVLAERDHFDLPVFRQVMQLDTQLYAGDTLGRLEELAPKA